MELLREILHTIEAQQSGRLEDITIDGYSDGEVRYHVRLADEQGWLHGVANTFDGIAVQGLTMAGHDFLEATRNDEVWRRVTRAIVEKGGGMPLEVVKALAVAYAKDLFKLSE